MLSLPAFLAGRLRLLRRHLSGGHAGGALPGYKKRHHLDAYRHPGSAARGGAGIREERQKLCARARSTSLRLGLQLAGLCYSFAGETEKMTSRVWLAIFFLLASAFAQSPNSSLPKEEELRRTEQSRVDALVNSDVPRLEKLLGDDLTYTHSTGIRESKAEFLHRIQSGEVKYDSMQHENGASIRLYGDT